MGFWTNKEHGTAFDDAEALAYPPSGGRGTMWLLGIGLALAPIGYGIHCLRSGHAIFLGKYSNLDITGPAATAAAIAYIAIGVFIHAHWFWGILPRFGWLSIILKYLAVLAFLGGFGYAMYRIIIS